MDCECCGAEVGGEKTYVLYALRGKRVQACICKGCMMLAMRAPSGSIITNKEVVQQPKLAFPYKQSEPQRAEFCKVARAEGWLTQSVTSDCVFIEAHYKQALVHNYFNGKEWKKNVGRSPLECFRRSCASIRDHYPEWLALKVGKD